jgi:hypothetical protein
LEEETTAESIELDKYVQMVVRQAAEGPIKTRGGTQGTRQKTGFARFKDIVLSFVFISNGEFCKQKILASGPACMMQSMPLTRLFVLRRHTWLRSP